MAEYDAVIIGCGASGLFAASLLSEAGLKIAVIEPNRFLGRKLRITGKGRCNLTNNCSAEEVMKNVPNNAKFLYSALNRFPPESIMNWFETHGVALKTERGRRVFPVSDDANEVAKAMTDVCSKNGVRIIRSKALEVITDCQKAVGVRYKDGEIMADNIICACGGMSYPKTGSDGSGYILAKNLGHSIIKPRPSLVPIETEESFCRKLSGLTLKNIELSLYDADRPKKPVYSELGEMTFYDYGIGGPLGITASCMMSEDKLMCKGYKLYIDLKPGLSAQKLDDRLLRDIKSAPFGNVEKLLSGLLPRPLDSVFAELLNLDKTAAMGNLTREKRQNLLLLLKRFELTPTAFRTFDEAIITRGGVSVSEIVPSTMESKLVKNLYFTGEILDVDAFTGGYNLTIAFATAYAAAFDIIRKKDVENGIKLCT